MIARSLQEALEELTTTDLSDLFAGFNTGVSASDAPAGGIIDVSEPTVIESFSVDGVSDDLTALVAEIERLQRAAAAALAGEEADWEEFGRLQARLQDLVGLLAAEAA